MTDEPIRNTNGISMQEAIELGITTPEEAEKLEASAEAYAKAIEASAEAYAKAFDALLRGNLYEFRISQAQEKAKRLSVNDDFQQAVEAFRERWQIQPRLYDEVSNAEWALGKFVFGIDNLWEQEPPSREWAKLHEDLRRTFCNSFNLDWGDDYGLLVAAICYGLTPENILNNWENMASTVFKSHSTGVPLVVHRSEANRDLGKLLTIVYIAVELHNAGVSLRSLPTPIFEWVRFALTKCGYRPENILKLMNEKPLGPNDPPIGELELFLRIKPETKKADIMRMLPLIEFHKVRLWGDTKTKKDRTWSTYERDTELAELVESCDNYRDAVIEYDRL